jgi:hypothetical protein
VGEEAQGGGRLLLKMAGVCQGSRAASLAGSWHKLEHPQYDDASVSALESTETVAWQDSRHRVSNPQAYIATFRA